MVAYWGLFSIFATGALFRHGGEGDRRSGIILTLAMCLLALFVGLRWEIGPDWPTYRALFHYLNDNGIAAALDNSDPGFRLLVMLLQSQHAPFWALNLVCACIFSFGLARFCTGLPNPWLAVLVAVPYLVVVIAMSALRQATALGFIFLALRDMGTKPLWKTLVWVLIGSLFHASAFIVAVLIALSYTQNRFQAAALLIASAIPAYYVLFGTFDEYLKRYGQHRIDSGGVAFRVAMNAIPAVILLVRGAKHFVPPREEVFWRALSIISLLLIPAILFVHSTTVIDRLSLYAIPLQILVLSAIPRQFSTSPATRIYYMLSLWRDPSAFVIGAPPSGARPVGAEFEGIGGVERMMAQDMTGYLTNDILAKVDRAAMAVSLETRVPFLDPEVVEFAWRLPLDFKIRGGDTKWLLRKVLYRHVPAELIERPKMGFGVPLDDWLRGPLREWVEVLLDERRLRDEGYFRPEMVRKTWDDHLRGQPNSHKLWTMLMFQSWLENQEQAPRAEEAPVAALAV